MIPSEIPPEEVEFHPLSFADTNGRVFWWKGELYRGISPERKDLYNKLLEPGIVQNLIKKGLLVETEVSSFSMNDYPLVLKHRVVPFVSYVYEWPSLMLKDAALALIEIAMELAKEGLSLQDAHPWNMLFNGSKPIYVDFGSIAPARPDTLWRAADEFYRFFVYPLQLMSHGYSRIARWLLHDYEQGVFQFECEALVHNPFMHLAKELQPLARACVPPVIRPGLKKLLFHYGSSDRLRHRKALYRGLNISTTYGQRSKISPSIFEKPSGQITTTMVIFPHSLRRARGLQNTRVSTTFCVI